ncbi:MAG: hypothetical protein U5K79_22730 [Cyclobacteriaceae bacterium]|nr:hypothetical protein [Cyclobacteriaceae bacterium]
MMKTSTLLNLAFFLTFANQVNGQLLPKASIVKAGFSTAGMSLQKEDQFSLHLDIENATKSPYFTSEFGFGLISRNEKFPVMSHPTWGHHQTPEGFYERR